LFSIISPSQPGTFIRTGLPAANASNILFGDHAPPKAGLIPSSPSGWPVDPNEPGAVWMDGDYHLRWDSPCINAGDPNFSAVVIASDIDGEPRIMAGRVDIGCDEVGQRQADFSRNGLINTFRYLYKFGFQLPAIINGRCCVTCIEIIS
jgi:hypothetical protein